MSTISDALKKVQKQRSGIEPERWRPEPAPMPPPPVRRLESPPDPARGSPVGGVVVAVVAVVLGVSVVMMRCSRENAARAGKVAAAEKPVAASVAARPPEKPAEAVREPAPRPVAEVPGEREISREESPPLAAPEPPPEVPPHKLVGIFYSERNPVAILDDFSLKEGETIGSYRVIRIQPESVTLQRAGEREVVLRLK